MRMMLGVAVLFAISLSAAAADTVLPHNLATAKAGEWTLMKDIAGETPGELARYSVAEVRGDGDDKVVVMRRERFGDDGEVAETRDFEINAARYAQRMAGLEDKAKQVSREKMKVKGRELSVFAVTWDHEGDDGETSEMKLWLSPDVPVGGLVKSWSSNPAFPAAELVDFGRE